MYDIESLRQNEFPISSNYIYFNHASTSPLPKCSMEKMRWAVEQSAKQPFLFWREVGSPLITTFQETAVAYLNTESPEEIVPATSTSAALNMIAQAVEWQPGDNIVFYEHEFPSNAYPWMSLEREGVEVRRVPGRKGGLCIEEMAAYVDGRTRLITVSAIQFFSGHRADLTALGQFCHERNILFVVDAIQAIGHIKMDVRAMNIDILATGGQKSIMSAMGAGFMYVKKSVAETLNPRLIYSNSTQDYLHWLAYDLTPRPGALRFMTGTLNLAGLFATVESLKLLQTLGVENIDRHTKALADAAIEMLSDFGFDVITPRETHGPIVTFATGLSSSETDALVNKLNQNKVTVVKHLDVDGNAYIRLSFHCYNTLAELRRFGDIFSRLCN